MLQKTEALDYLNAQLEKAEMQNNETIEKLKTLDLRLQQMLLGIADIFKYVFLGLNFSFKNIFFFNTNFVFLFLGNYLVMMLLF